MKVFVAFLALFAVAVSGLSLEKDFVKEDEFSLFNAKDVWNKVQIAARKIKVDAVGILKEYKPKILDALKDVGKVVIEAGKEWVIEVKDGVVQIIHDEMTASSDGSFFESDAKIWYIVDTPFAEINGFTDFWKKVGDAIKDYSKDVQAELKEILTKYKPRIVKALKKVKKIAIKEGKDLIVEMAGDTIKVVIKSGMDDDDEMLYGYQDMWAKVIKTANRITGLMKDETLEILNKYKPKIINAINGLKNVVISCGHDVVVQIKDDVVKIITDGVTVTSDGSNPSEFAFEGDYILLHFPNANPAVTYSTKSTWAKLQQALKNFGEKIKKLFTDDFHKKIIDLAKETFNKYKDLILEALHNDATVMINEGKKIVIEALDDVVSIIIDGIDAVSGEGKASAYKFEDLWDKVKVTAKKLGHKIKKDVVVILKEYKPKIIDALKDVGKVVVRAGKDWVIEVKDGVVKIITDEGMATSDDSFFSSDATFWYIIDSPVPQINQVTDVWNKVVAAIKDYSKDVQAELKEILTKYKPRIVKALKKVKKIAIKEGKDLIVEMAGDTIKVVIKSGMDDDDDEVMYGGFNDLWQKVKHAASKLKPLLRDTTLKIINKYKQEVIDKLHHVGELVIEAGKKIAIVVKDDIVHVLVDGEEVTSENAYYDDATVEYGRGRMIWEKIKHAASKLKPLLRETTLKIINKYKQEVIDKLHRVGELVIEAGKKIAIVVKDDVVHVLVDGEEVTSEETYYEDAELSVEYGRGKMIWEKIKRATKKLKPMLREATMKVINKHKTEFIKALKNVGKVVIEGGKKIVAKVIDDVVHVFVDGEEVTSA